MILGFTGTRSGMTDPQKAAFRKLVEKLQPREFRHGDCVGADEESHDIVREIVPECRIIIHPPIDTKARAWRTGDAILTPLTHFARNREIVRASMVMAGASLTAFRTERGGTWYTLDFAVKVGRPIHVLWPDGHVTQGKVP